MANNETLTKHYILHMSQDNNNPPEDTDVVISDEDQFMFRINFSIFYEIEYLPHRHCMNLKSHIAPPFHLSRNKLHKDSALETMSRLLSYAVVSDEEIESIAASISSKASSIEENPKNINSRVIPIVISLRIVWVQEYNRAAELAWNEVLPEGTGMLPSKLPAMAKAVEELETVVVNEGIELKENCAICLKEFEVGEEITRMPCLHFYHGDCIGEWLKSSHLCPVCRFPMPVCRIIDGTFPFLKRKRQQVGGRTKKGARMCVRYSPYQLMLQI